MLSEKVKHGVKSLLHLAQEIRRQDELVYCSAEGNLANNGGRLVVHYLGRRRFANDFLMFYDRDTVDAAVNQSIRYEANPLRFWLDRTRAQKCPPDADVLFVDRFLSPTPRPGDVVLAPFINALLPVQDTLDEQISLIRSKGHRRKLQSALKRQFSWRKTYSIADFNLFYDVMYAPFVQERFRYDASTVPRQEMRRMFLKRGFLLFVEEDGVPISGAMIYTTPNHPGTMFYWKYGLAHSKTLTPAVFGERNAMTEAMVLRHAVEERYKDIDFGLTRAMPWDGIFTHKKRLGCDFRKVPHSPEFTLLINDASKARLLSRFPLIVNQGAAVRTWLAQEGELTDKTVEAFKENLRACAFPSVGGIDLFTRGVSESADLLYKASQEVAQDTASPIEVQRLG